ncbi:MAG: hypothetical protein ABIG28_03110 [archaeon]
MIALTEDGLEKHRRVYRISPAEVETRYLGNGRYKVRSVDEKNENEFEKIF